MKITKEQIKKDLKNKNAIIPNILSASRMPAPIVILGFTFTYHPLLAMLSAGGFALTDFFDGKIARKFNGQTEFGRLLDATSDKIFTLGMILPLIPTNYFLALTLALEGAIAYINGKSYKDDENPKTIFQGKVKTALLSTTLLLECLAISSGIPQINTITNISLLATTVLQLSNIKKYNQIAKEKKNKSIENKQNEVQITETEETKQKTYSLEKENIEIKHEQTREEELEQLKELKKQLTYDEQKTTEEVKTLTKQKKKD